MQNDDEQISASEINQFTHCPYQWYYMRFYGGDYIKALRKEKFSGEGPGELSRNLSRGRDFHSNYLQNEKARLRKQAIKVSLCIILLALAAVILIKTGIQWPL